MPSEGRGILSPVRLPVPPLQHAFPDPTRDRYRSPTQRVCFQSGNTSGLAVCRGAPANLLPATEMASYQIEAAVLMPNSDDYQNGTLKIGSDSADVVDFVLAIHLGAC